MRHVLSKDPTQSRLKEVRRRVMRSNSATTERVDGRQNLIAYVKFPSQNAFMQNPGFLSGAKQRRFLNLNVGIVL